MEDEFYNDLLVELECAVCTNYMSPPIRQCQTGHSICDGCCKRLPACPLCQAKFNDARNISLEALAAKMRYPCINQRSGCTARLGLNEREQHELLCLFKGYRCQLPKCAWVGKSEDIVSHWVSKNMSSKPYQDKNICHTKIKTDSYYVNLVRSNDELFWYKFKSSLGKLQWCVQYIGSPDNADDYFYEIEIFKQGQPKSKILVSDYCQDLNIDNAELFKQGNCISVSVDMVSQFVSDDQLLIYYMRVFKVAEGAKKEFDQRHRRYNKNPHQKHPRRDHSANSVGHKSEKSSKHSHHHKSGKRL